MYKSYFYEHAAHIPPQTWLAKGLLTNRSFSDIHLSHHHLSPVPDVHADGRLDGALADSHPVAAVRPRHDTTPAAIVYRVCTKL